jgi:hypothetical protein
MGRKPKLTELQRRVARERFTNGENAQSIAQEPGDAAPACLGGLLRDEPDPNPTRLSARNYAYDDRLMSAPNLIIDGIGHVVGALNCSRVDV